MTDIPTKGRFEDGHTPCARCKLPTLNWALVEHRGQTVCELCRILLLDGADGPL